jgi:glycosyltransferase involved in cell wall biosynthesis
VESGAAGSGVRGKQWTVKLRVGFDARWYNDSGVGTYVAELLRALASHQEEIELIVYEDPLNPVQSLTGTNVQRVPVRASRYSLNAQVVLARRTRVDRLNVFHSPFYMMPLAASCPVIVTIHDLIPFLFPIYSAVKQMVVKTGYRVAANQAAHIIADSLNTARDVERLLKTNAEKITAVPIAADRSRYSPDAAEGELTLLREKFGVAGPYVMAASARNWRHKNLEGALKALELTRTQAGVEFQTIVYGPGDGLKAAGGPQLWRNIGLRHTGYTGIDDLAILFRHARAFIMPSLYEGFGLPVLEAMSCACPVITSTGGSLPEVAGEGAQVFATDDVTGMGAALAELLTSERNLEQWRVAALARAAEFSWDRTALKTINVYRKVAAASLRAAQQ